MRMRRAGLAMTLSLPLLLSGCLITLGGPLARRVEPGRWRMEAAAGPSLTNEYGTLSGLGYAYAGHALGRHWEMGLMPYLYAWDGEVVLSLAGPVRWDPFPHSWPLHLVPFAGPAVFWAPGTAFGGGGLTGLGLSLRMGELAEFYAAASAFVPATRFVSSSVGARFDLANGFELGLGAVLVNGGEDSGDGGPGLVMACVSLSTLLGGR